MRKWFKLSKKSNKNEDEETKPLADIDKLDIVAEDKEKESELFAKLHYLMKENDKLKSPLFHQKKAEEVDTERVAKIRGLIQGKNTKERLGMLRNLIKEYENYVKASGRRASSEEKNERDEVKQTEKVSPKVAKKRGKVPLLEYDVLRGHRVEMVNQLDPVKVISYLKQNKVIDQDDVEKIEKKCKDLRRKGAEAMLDILYNSGSWAFTQLVKALEYAGYQEMAQNLTADLTKKTIDPHSANNTKQRGRLSEIEFEVLTDNRERMVNELDSSVLKNHLFQNGLIDEDDLERISKKEEELRKEGVEEMLNIIYYSGLNVFPQLIKSLADAGYDELSSKLDSDFKQKQKAMTKHGLTIDLNSLEFPQYPYRPQLKLETIQRHDWQQRITELKGNDAGKSWCVTMNNWFKDHEFESDEELKMVIRTWLLKLKEVVEKGCLDIDYIHAILPVTERFRHDFSRTRSTEGAKEIAKTKEADKRRHLEQQRKFFEKLKDNLEGIIEGKQNSDLLSIDTESCELAGYFHSVVDDVREIWNALL